MKKILLFLSLFFVLFVSAQNKYDYFIDLINVKNDQVEVTLTPPAITKDEIHFNFPKTVPGTYAVIDYGRFIDNLRALDENENELEVVKEGNNHFRIKNATKLKRIAYKVNDSFDAIGMENPIFEPAGTNIEAGKNFILNFQGFIGYFEDMIFLPFDVKIAHPADMKAATSLRDMDESDKNDLFSVKSYHDLVDNPAMYCVPDFAKVKVGNTDILVAIYSPSKKANAEYIAKAIDTLLQAQGKYLGGKLPVDNYAFIIYLTKEGGLSGGLGALEHSYSSLYFLQDESNEELVGFLKSIAAHEFFHIVTPLNIHAVQIGNFDYDNPEMSEHLWLYEGTTEYHAHAVQVRYDLITEDNFLETIRDKMEEARTQYDDKLSFTKMSKECLGKYKDQYNNVYAKGMLIGMCLDLKLIEWSKGKYRLMDLINDLAKTYGKDKSFKDDELIGKIQELTYPGIKEFFDKYVYEGNPLPFRECLGVVGVRYMDKVNENQISLGQIELGFNPLTMRLVVNGTDNMNEFGKTMGYQKGDELRKFNGVLLKPENMQEVFGKWKATAKEGDKLTIEVARKKGEKTKNVKLKGKIFPSNVTKYNIVSIDKNAPAEVIALRNAWLKAR